MIGCVRLNGGARLGLRSDYVAIIVFATSGSGVSIFLVYASRFEVIPRLESEFERGAL